MMRIKFFTGCLAAALMVMVTSSASAQDKFNAPAPKIAVVDVQAAVRDSLAGKSARDQMEAIARKEQTSLAEEEKKLRAQDQELQQQRAILTPEVYAQRQQKLKADVGNLQNRSRNLRLTLDRGFRRTLDQISLVLIDELRKLTTELELNLILRRSQIVIAVDDFDLTKTALERLNKRFPSIELKLEKSANADKAK